jgi:hypothetical protein
MDSPLQHDLIIDIGRDFNEYFGFTDDADTPLDMTGYTVKAQIRSGESSGSTLIAEFTVDNSALADGELWLRLTDAQTAAITASSGYYDILVTDASGTDETWVFGTVTFQGRPTDA